MIHRDLPFEDYLKLPGASNSSLKPFSVSPMHARHRFLHGQTETAPLAFGRAFHCAVLEPESFQDRYVCVPADAPRRPSILQRNAKKPSPETLESIKFWDEFGASGKTVIDYADMQKVTAMAAAIHAHPLARSILQGEHELSIQFTESETGEPCKVRLDCWHEEFRVIFDAKSCQSAAPAVFGRQAASLRYHVQAAMYLDAAIAAGLEPEHFIFVCVESEAPHAVALYEFDEAAIERGRATYQRDLKTLSECRESGNWPGYPEVVGQLTLPAWAA